MTTPPDETLIRLRRVDSCAISDALDQLGLAGVVDGINQLTGSKRIAGRAVTVLLGPPSRGLPTRHLCSEAVDSAGPDDVVVVAHQQRRDCAGWGGNLSRAALHRGVEGTIVDGAVRDVDEAESIGYPVFAAGATPRTARGRTQEHAWSVRVAIGGVTVNPGDYVVADRSGIVVVAAGNIAEVLEVAERIAKKETRMASAIEAGEPVTRVMGADYETMLQGRES
jgi:4-hydroxy-4-methyl-2-oxoglutarate aldolase